MPATHGDAGIKWPSVALRKAMQALAAFEALSPHGRLLIGSAMPTNQEPGRVRVMKKTATLWAVLPALAAWGLSACGSGQSDKSVTPQFDGLIDQAKVEAALAAWPKVMGVYPGLAAHAEYLTANPGAGYFLDAADVVPTKMVAAFDVSERIVDDPAMATAGVAGHTCYFKIDYPTSGAVHIPKEPCQALCLNRRSGRSPEDMILVLH